MKPAAWRVLTLAFGILLLALSVLDIMAGIAGNADQGFVAKPGAHDVRRLTVTKVTDRRAIDGALEPGDTVRLADQSFTNRVLFARQRPGDRFTFVRTSRDGRTSTFTDTLLPAGPVPFATESLLVMGFVFVLVGVVLAARRPEDELARLLVGLLLSLGTVMVTGPLPYFPAWVLVAVLALHLFSQPFSAYAAMALAVSFPRRSTRGPRRWLARANAPLLAICVVTLFGSFFQLLVRSERPPGWLQAAGIALTLAYYAGIAVAFVIAARGIDSAERKRLQWVGWTLAAGFSGELVLVALIAFRVPLGDWTDWLNFTLLAIPFGLAYAIVRHRVIDIGFVVNRALVFGTVSAVVLLAFGALEWLLGTVLVRVSHITSTALELALALVLGFSLRGIHARADRFIDDVFFRERHEAERALRAFARDVAFIGDPAVAVARTHDELARRTGATAAAIYVVDPPDAVRVDLGETAAPARADLDDPAFVRLRATRAPLALRDVESALPGDRVFPMYVRDSLTGAVVLGAKSTGETYAPDEIATIETVVLALGAALDALHTAALKAELARVLVDGASLETLRRTVESAAWVRGVVAQPAGSLPGLIK